MTVSPLFRRISFSFVTVLLALGVVAGLAVLGVVGPAQAHDQILSSAPESGAKLDTAPTQIKLTFSETPMEDSAKMVAATSGGQKIPLDEPTVKGKVVTVPWPTQDAGSFDVNWRVVSSDGHPINGTIAFQVLGSTESPTVPVESPSDSTVTTQATPTAESESSTSNMGGMIAGLAAAIVAATILVVILVRRRDQDDDAN